MVDILGINIEAFRFRLMIAPIFAAGIAIGCFILFQILDSKKSKKLPQIVVCSLCILLVVFSPIYVIPTDAYTYINTENNEANYFNESEISLLTHIEEYIPFGKSILSDHIIYRYYTTIENDYGIPNYRVHDKLYTLFSGETDNDQIAEYTVFPK